MRRLALLILLCGSCALTASGVLVTVPALAGQTPVADCNAHGTLTQHYTVAELQSALSTMPADIKEYTDCYDVIERALLTAIGGSHHSGGGGSVHSSGGSFLPTPLIVVLVALGLGAVGFGVAAIRRRDSPGGEPGADDPAASGP